MSDLISVNIRFNTKEQMVEWLYSNEITNLTTNQKIDPYERSGLIGALALSYGLRNATKQELLAILPDSSILTLKYTYTRTPESLTFKTISITL